MNIRIATRGSRLALCQSEIVRKKIMSLDPSARCELVIVRTAGDRNQHAPLHALGGKGVFVREIEECLLNGEADLAVHSMKDMPAELPQGLCFADAWEGEDPRDALVLRQGIDEQTLHARPCVIATGSLRRAAQLKRLYPKVTCVDIRGNVETRLARMEERQLDGLVLAAAGLIRLGLRSRIARCFDEEEMVPAPAQGMLALECRTQDEDLLALLRRGSDARARSRAYMERGFLQAMHADCHQPVGACLRHQGSRLIFDCMWGNAGAASFAKAQVSGTCGMEEELLNDAVDIIERQVHAWAE